MHHGLAAPSFNLTSAALLQGILEGLLDGVLILTDRGEWVYSNQDAQRICQQIQPQLRSHPTVPAALWRLCQPFIASRAYPHHPSMLESELHLPTGMIRVRLRWLSFEAGHPPYLAVLLEDQQLSQRRRAIAEAQRFGLTPRQAEVWLLRRSGYSYRDIATQLYISIDTVKRHLKDIYARQKLQNLAEDEFN